MTNIGKINLYKLFKIQCMDILCLIDMERNGIKFNTEKAMTYAKELETQCNKLRGEFNSIVNCDVVNLGSNDHLSACLYGGIITNPIRVAVGHYKSGKKRNEVKYQWQDVVYEFPRLVTSLPKTETAKSAKKRLEGCTDRETIWEVNEPVLRSLKASGEGKKLIAIVLEFNKLDKLRGTYLEGYTKLIDEMDWESDTLHTSFNQCTVVTGSLSSSRPNIQNCDKITKNFMESRYG